jgi:hypothetical protein
VQGIFSSLSRSASLHHRDRTGISITTIVLALLLIDPFHLQYPRV